MENIKFGFAEGEDHNDQGSGQGATYDFIFNGGFQSGNMLGNDTSFDDLLNGRLNAQAVEVSDLSNALTCRHHREVN